MSRSRAVALASAGLAGAALAVHAAPALLWIDPVRCRLTPRLAGIGRRGHVALTFDDGPDPASTPAILEALDDLGWHATFFMLGSMVDRHPAVAVEVAEAGHELAVHGYEHRGSLRRTPRAMAEDVRRATDTIASTTGSTPRWFRPPFGEMSAGAIRAARRANLDTVMWSAWGRDWRPEATPDSVLSDIGRGVVTGGTILLHDSDCTSAPNSWRTTLATLPLLAERLANDDLVVGPLSDHGVG
jgi:peptidoglycan/xylan/chitin deacetylase (PgdA/CDA1 family)